MPSLFYHRIRRKKQSPHPKPAFCPLPVGIRQKTVKVLSASGESGLTSALNFPSSTQVWQRTGEQIPSKQVRQSLAPQDQGRGLQKQQADVLPFPEDKRASYWETISLSMDSFPALSPCPERPEPQWGHAPTSTPQVRGCACLLGLLGRLCGFNYRPWFPHSPGGQKPEIQVPAGWVSSEASLLGLPMSIFSLCPHRALPVCLDPNFLLLLKITLRLD